MEKLQRFYFDTSVFGGVYDAGFDEASMQLFERVRLGTLLCLYSDIANAELTNAPPRVRQFFASLPPEHMERVELSEEARLLARTYVEEGVVGATSFTDCLHIALATIHNADMLTSWNFRHIVNVYRIRGYNAINLRLGYHALEIRSPKDLLNYGDAESED